MTTPSADPQASDQSSKVGKAESSRSKHSGRTVAEKLALLAGSGAAIAAAPATSEAAIVMSTTAPIATMAGFDNTNNWDVDGDGTVDFALINIFSIFSTSTTTSFFFDFDDRNGGRLVAPAGAALRGISLLPADEIIGAGLDSAYQFHAAAQTSNSIAYMAYGTSINIGSDAAAGGWSLGDTGFFGFRFTNTSGGTHFGWGELTINADASGFSVNRAYYNDVAGESIAVGAIPEPSSVALLALGAAGLATWRRRKSAA